MEITHTRDTITVEAATQLIAAGLRAAAARNIAVTIAVADVAGELTALARADRASMLSMQVACDKAWTSATTGAPTAALHDYIKSDAGALLSMPTVPRFTVVAGGLPLFKEGEPIGAIGVSGGTSEQDLAIAHEAVLSLGA